MKYGPTINRRTLLAFGGGVAAGLLVRPYALQAAPGKTAPRMERALGRFKIKDVLSATINVEGEYPCNFIKVTTESGPYGLGEARPKIQISKLVSKYKKMIIGEDPSRIDDLARKMMAANKRPSTSDLGAIAGIETALWDLAGKILETPACNLIGGKHLEGVPVYYDLSPSDTPKTMDPRPWIQRVHFAKKSGYNSMKIDISRNGGNVPQWINVLEKIREEVRPDEMKIGLDFHWKLNSEDTFKFVEMAKPLSIWFVEDPMKYTGNEKHYQQLAAEGKIPIMAGELLLTIQSFRDLIKKRMCNLLEVDGQYVGGLLPLKRIMDLGKQNGLKTLCHNMCTPVGTYAQAHACVTTSSCIALESPIAEKAIQHDGPMIKDGFLELNDKPGFGIELNEDYCRKRLVKGSEFFGT